MPSLPAVLLAVLLAGCLSPVASSPAARAQEIDAGGDGVASDATAQHCTYFNSTKDAPGPCPGGPQERCTALMPDVTSASLWGCYGLPPHHDECVPQSACTP